MHFTPSLANLFAIDAPIPRDAPVMRHVLPERRGRDVDIVRRKVLWQLEVTWSEVLRRCSDEIRLLENLARIECISPTARVEDRDFSCKMFSYDLRNTLHGVLRVVFWSDLGTSHMWLWLSASLDKATKHATTDLLKEITSFYTLFFFLAQ